MKDSLTNSTLTLIFDKIQTHFIEDKPTSAAFVDKQYGPILFNNNSYHILQDNPLQPINQKINPITNEPLIGFIDGGNIEIIGNKVFSVHIIRTYGVLYTGLKRTATITHEFLAIASKKIPNVNTELEMNNEKLEANNERLEINNNNKTNANIEYTVEVYRNEKIHATYTVTSAEETISNAIDYARRMQEIHTALELTSIIHATKKNVSTTVSTPEDTVHYLSLIVLDGSLKTTTSAEAETLKQLINTAQKLQIGVIGIVKNSGIATNTGSSLINALSTTAPTKKSWIYYPICNNHNNLHPAEICAVKFHPLSNYSFILEMGKTDTNTTQVKSNTVIEQLKQNAQILCGHSKDPSFLGYPYGLIEADLQARCKHQEKTYLLTRFIHLCQKNNINNMNKGIIQTILANAKAHDLLDHLAGTTIHTEVIR